jgi:hypothetical protein
METKELEGTWPQQTFCQGGDNLQPADCVLLPLQSCYRLVTKDVVNPNQFVAARWSTRVNASCLCTIESARQLARNRCGGIGIVTEVSSEQRASFERSDLLVHSPLNDSQCPFAGLLCVSSSKIVE